MIVLGILRDKTMDDKLIYFPNDDKQNDSFSGSKSLVEMFKHNYLDPTNQISTNKPKVF